MEGRAEAEAAEMEEEEEGGMKACPSGDEANVSQIFRYEGQQLRAKDSSGEDGFQRELVELGPSRARHLSAWQRLMTQLLLKTVPEMKIFCLGLQMGISFRVDRGIHVTSFLHVGPETSMIFERMLLKVS
jgi:hypothetical protein